MKKKGFTLPELIAVIVVVAILAIIAVTNVSKVMIDSREKLKAQSLNQVRDSAASYGMKELFISNNCAINYIVDKDHPISLPSGCSVTTVKVGDLITKGYFKDDSNNLKKDGEITIYKYKTCNPNPYNSSDEVCNYDIKAYVTESLFN